MRVVGAYDGGARRAGPCKKKKLQHKIKGCCRGRKRRERDILATAPRLLRCAALRTPPLPGALCSKSAPSRRCSASTVDKAPASRSLNGNPSVRETSAPRATHSAKVDVASDIFAIVKNNYALRPCLHYSSRTASASSNLVCSWSNLDQVHSWRPAQELVEDLGLRLRT